MSKVSGNDMARLMDLKVLSEEPLHPDLVDWVEEQGPLGGKMLRHPLVYDMFLTLPGQANRVYLRKKELIAEAIGERDWHAVVFHHERAHRFNALIEYVIGRDEYGEVIPLSALLPDGAAQGLSDDLLSLVADVWVDSENISQHIEDWAALFGDCLFFLGTYTEQLAFRALPDPVRAYRAGIDDGDWSWSTQRSTAEFFARRFDDPPLPVIEAEIPKSRCFGYLTRRGEAELLVRLES